MGRNAADSPRISPAKRVLFWLVIVLTPLVGLELGARTYFAYQLGSSLFFYGTRLYREKHGDAHSGDMNFYNGYFKYHPHEEGFTRDKERHGLIRVTINGEGFRGPDFETPKDPGVIRVLTLGASSTFGFSDRDDETYPYYLERLLNQEAPRGRTFEVINFGIPHLKSEQIAALFETEGLPLHPDVVTFYEGINDTWRSRVLFRKTSRGPGVVRTRLRRYSPLHEGFTWLRNHSILVTVADGFLKRRRHATFTAAEVVEHMRGKSEEFVANVARIRELCARNGITFIVGSQQSQSMTLNRRERRGVTYEEELSLVRRILAEDGHVNADQLNFLTHAALMHDLRGWCEANGVPYVDIIAALDRRRDCLVSWVHLNAEGNRIVAAAFAGEVLAQLHEHHALRVDPPR
jgi:lysophospholipase L1-like esterase